MINFLIVPNTFLGRSRPQTTSKELGFSTCSFTREKFLGHAAIAEPPPRLAPGLGVEMQDIPFVSSNCMMLDWCLRFSFFSQTSLSIEMSTDLSMMSSARLFSLDQIDLMLQTVKVGRLLASRSLLSLTIRLLKQCLLPSCSLEKGLDEIKTGIAEESTKDSLKETFPSS